MAIAVFVRAAAIQLPLVPFQGRAATAQKACSDKGLRRKIAAMNATAGILFKRNRKAFTERYGRIRTNRNAIQLWLMKSRHVY